LARLLEVLSHHASDFGYSGVVWISATLSRPFPNSGMYAGPFDVILRELKDYTHAVVEAQLKGPSGVVAKAEADALQCVGLVPSDYKLLHANGRLDLDLSK
jgi:hypothetical protein